MNKAKMLELADVMEKSTRFDCFYWATKPVSGGKTERTGLISEVLNDRGDFCGTTLCIAGEAALLASKSQLRGENAAERIPDIAMEYLGLNAFQANFLFYGEWSPDGSTTKDNTLAAKTIRAMAGGANIDDLTYKQRPLMAHARRHHPQCPSVR